MTLPIKALLGLSGQEFLKIVNDDAAKFTYSQLGEDVTLHYLLTSHKASLEPGFYVDAGAFHPRLYSNTRFLNLLGWRGLNIDASEEAIALFNAERPRDINICSGVGPTEGELTFYKFAGGAASTCSREQAEVWQQQLGWSLVGTSQVRIRTLNAILQEHLPPQQSIDYLNIDLEGFDAAVLQGLDFTRYRPRILSVELHAADKMALGSDPSIALLSGLGYRLMAINVVTYVFMHSDYLRG